MPTRSDETESCYLGSGRGRIAKTRRVSLPGQGGPGWRVDRTVKMLAGPRTNPTHVLIVDSHVHIHPRFSYRDTFDAALRNVRGLSRSLGGPGPFVGVLMLAESAGQDRFGQLVGRQNGAAGHWRLQPTGEICSVLIRREEDTLIVLAGRQIVTAERLEVLALATRESFKDGRDIDETLVRVGAAGAVPVVPWGWGKWWFRRGARIRELLHSSEPGAFYLGDNGGRVRGMREPTLLRMARRQGIAVLPGSDPLPLPGDVERVGSYGFLLDTVVDWTHPAQSVVRGLRELRGQPATLGRLRAPGAALLAQVRLRFR